MSAPQESLPGAGRPSGRVVLGRVLAVIGTAVLLFPLAAPLLLAAIFAVAGAGLHLDYLMPGELFIVVAAGGAVLLAASLILRRLRWPVGALLAATAALFAATVVTAGATGVSTGENSSGSLLAIVFAVYAMYVVAVAALAAAGVVLCVRVFRVDSPAGAATALEPSA